MTVKCASTHAILNIEQRMVQDLMERFGTTEAELEEEHIEGILDVISSEVGLSSPPRASVCAACLLLLV